MPLLSLWIDSNVRIKYSSWPWGYWNCTAQDAILSVRRHRTTHQAITFQFMMFLKDNLDERQHFSQEMLRKKEEEPWLSDGAMWYSSCRPSPVFQRAHEYTVLISDQESSSVHPDIILSSSQFVWHGAQWYESRECVVRVTWPVMSGVIDGQQVDRVGDPRVMPVACFHVSIAVMSQSPGPVTPHTRAPGSDSLYSLHQ